MTDRVLGVILFGIAALAAWHSRHLMPPWLILAGGIAFAWWGFMWLARRHPYIAIALVGFLQGLLSGGRRGRW